MDLFHRLGEEWQKMVNSVQSLKKDNSALHEQVMSLSFLPSRIRHLEEKELENSRLIERLGRRIEELKHETQNQFQTMEECLEPVARKDTEERLLRSLEADLTDVVGDREKVLGSLTNLEDLTCDKRDLTTLEGKVQQTTNSAKTGEEEEEEVFQSRARMYRFVSGEWKEKGTGVIKILEHEQTKKARVFMRRDKVLKICCNHTITSDLDLQPMSKMEGKAWLWYALDYSDEESKMEQLAVRFKEPETAEEFKNVFNGCKMRGASSLTPPQKKTASRYLFLRTCETTSVDSDDDVIFVKQETSPAALLTVEPGTPVSTGTTTTTTTMTTNGTTTTGTTHNTTTDNTTTTTGTMTGTTTTGTTATTTTTTNGTTTTTDPRDDEDVIFVKEDHASPEQKALAAKYKLPANFYLYEDRKPCRGCLGCTDGEGLPPYKVTTTRSSTSKVTTTQQWTQPATSSSSSPPSSP